MQTNKRLAELFDYIEETTKLANPPQYRIQTEGHFVIWQDELRSLPGVSFNIQTESDHVWLKVDRLTEGAPPEPATVLRPWLMFGRGLDTVPTLRETVIEKAGNHDQEILRLVDLPENVRSTVQREFENYKAIWHVWVEAERPRRKTIALYSKLFALEQALELDAATNPQELVWGLGVSVWSDPERGISIDYPLITKLVELSLNHKTLAIEVRPRDTDPRVELGPYVATNNLGILSVQKSAQAFLDNQALTLSPFDEGSFQPILRAAVTHLDPNGKYWPDHAPNKEDKVVPKGGKELLVTDVWVVYSRKRSQNFLVEDLQRLKQAIEGGAELPEGPLSLVLPPSDEAPVDERVLYRGVSYGAVYGEGIELRELYFPKPYNDEQVSIVARLENHPGVVVQGPPGTGKTHTIANVICHYLAQGKRVLVSSKGEPALSVLREQIPDDIRALTVALLSSERDGMKQFEHAIQRMAFEISRIDPVAKQQEIDGLKRRIDELHSHLAAIDRDISQWAERHLTQVQFHGRPVLPDVLAKHVVENEKRFGWLTDPLTIESLHEPQFSHDDILRLRDARRRVGVDLEYLNSALPVAEEFPDGLGLIKIHQDLARAKEIERVLAADGQLQLANSTDEVFEKAERLFDLVKHALTYLEQLAKAPHEWLHRLRAAYHRANDEPAIAALERLLPDIDALLEERKAFLARPVEIPEGSHADNEFIQAVARLGRGERPFGIFALGVGDAKKRIAAVLVDGNSPTGEGHWQHVGRYLRFLKDFRSVATRWNVMAQEAGLPMLASASTSEVRTLVEYRTQIVTVKALALECDLLLPGFAQDVFAEAFELDHVRHSGKAVFEQLHDVLLKHIQRRHLSMSWNALEAIKAKLAGKRGPIIRAMQNFLVEWVGKPGANESSLQHQWVEFLAELRRIHGQRQYFTVVKQVTQAIEKSGAPEWARRCASEPVSADREDLLVPTDWLEAWEWRRLKAYLDTIDGRHELRRLQENRASLELDLSTSYEKLVVTMTWLSVFRNSTDKTKSALAGFMNAINRIGKGTGIRAVRYRKDARDAMQSAHAAVPCWIMPHWRVSESFPPELGLFDLVIIDEASQSDLWALPVLVRGKKMLIVGDDKQVSPEGIGIEEVKIEDLRNRFLANQVYAAEMTPEKSIYDLAKRMFAGSQVMLREHFRCVEPIIAFSNREFYNGEIRPLRVPRASERLDPPLIDVFVKGGFRQGASKINKPEAESIVEEIEHLCKDDRFRGRTIGVVSLLGYDQAKLIEQMLQKRIGAAEIVSRHIECGDARTFQGKERHIMFLSMVAAGKVTALSGRIFEQRFNVAASRAKDRMYLYRSVELTDLNPNDLRARLLQHMANPMHVPEAKVQTLRDLCESGFEREVFDILVGKGYRVTPQVPVGAYRIDLVVQGDEDRRLAVECDGDQYHGPGRWQSDMKRQRVLERAGWRFWRCFASTFTLHRDECIEELLGTLIKMGIEPIGPSTPRSSYTEQRIIEPKQAGLFEDL